MTGVLTFQYLDLDRDRDAQEFLDRFHVTLDDVPILLCRNDVVLRNPGNADIAECLGFNETIDQEHLNDLVTAGGFSPSATSDPAMSNG